MIIIIIATRIISKQLDVKLNKKCDFKKNKGLQRNVENINSYDCNQTFTMESNFGIK